jgi:hypothetical protein
MESIQAISILKTVNSFANASAFLSLLGFIVILFGTPSSRVYDHGIIPAFLLKIGLAIVCTNSLYAVLTPTEVGLRELCFSLGLAVFTCHLFIDHYVSTFKLKYKIKRKSWF